MSGLLTEIISLLVAGLQTFATGLGSGLNNLVRAIFIDTSGETLALSTMGGVIVIFGAIAISVGLSKWVVNFLTSWGR